MHERDRVKLLGHYLTPRFRYGDTVTCAMRGEMNIVGLSNARIPLAQGPHREALAGRDSVRALAEAVRRESGAGHSDGDRAHRSRGRPGCARRPARRR